MASRGASNDSSLMFPASSVHYVWNSMRIAGRRGAQIILSIVIIAGCCQASDATARKDPKKSQAAVKRGRRLDQSGQRADAIAAYTEAVEADAGNAEAWRARGSDYLAVGEREKALADLNHALQIHPGDGLSYTARGDAYL